MLLMVNRARIKGQRSLWSSSGCVTGKSGLRTHKQNISLRKLGQRERDYTPTNHIPLCLLLKGCLNSSSVLHLQYNFILTHVQYIPKFKNLILSIKMLFWMGAGQPQTLSIAMYIFLLSETRDKNLLLLNYQGEVSPFFLRQCLQVSYILYISMC